MNVTTYCQVDHPAAKLGKAKASCHRVALESGSSYCELETLTNEAIVKPLPQPGEIQRPCEKLEKYERGGGHWIHECLFEEPPRRYAGKHPGFEHPRPGVNEVLFTGVTMDVLLCKQRKLVHYVILGYIPQMYPNMQGTFINSHSLTKKTLTRPKEDWTLFPFWAVGTSVLQHP